MTDTTIPDTRVRCRPIVDADIEAVAALLSRGFPWRKKTYFLDGLRRLQRRPSPPDLPRYGFLLESAGQVVGTVLLMFSEREGTDGVRCNIASWYVDPPFRGHASLLSSMALKYKQVTYLNVTPAVNTWPILDAQGYRRYCNGLSLVFPALKRCDERVTITTVNSDSQHIDGLAPSEMAILREHASYGCHSLVVRTADGAFPFVLIPFRVRNGRIRLPVMQLVYARDSAEFNRFAGPIGRKLLMHGHVAVLMDAMAPIEDMPGLYTERRGRKYCRGPGQGRLADLIDSELVLFGP